MPDIREALSKLSSLGMHLDPEANAAEARARNVRLNAHVYPLYRAIGFQIILVVAGLHNAAVFGEVGWEALLLYAAIVEVYVLATWLALRRWFAAFPPVRGWDLSDLVFLTDLILWAGAIIVTGADQSWLWVLPLVRVADHRAAARVFDFAALAPLTYLAVALWADLRPGGAVAWDAEGFKILLLLVAGYYIAFTGRHLHRLQEQRGAALAVAAHLLGKLRERTERLDHANRARGDLLTRIRDGLGAPLVEIVGFSQTLLRSSTRRSASEEDYLQRIHRQARWVLRILDDLPDLPDVTATWPRVSLTGLMQEAAAIEAAPDPDAAEAGQPGAPPSEDAHIEPARLTLPAGDLEIRTEPRRMTALLQHLYSAARHFGDGAPQVVLRLDAATHLPDAIEVTAALPAVVGTAEAPASSDLLNPFSPTATTNQEEMGARFELNLARTIADLLGYRLELKAGTAQLRFTLRLR